MFCRSGTGQSFAQTLALVALSMVLVACEPEAHPRREPPAAGSPAPKAPTHRKPVAFSPTTKKRVLESLPSPTFREMTQPLGLTFRHQASRELASRRAELVMPVGLEGGGVAAGDFDADTFPDLYFAGDGGGALYRNNKGSRLDDVSNSAGLGREGETRAGYFIDYDSDGDLDLFLTFVYRTNRLHQNDGTLPFRDVTHAVGLDSKNDVTHEAVWFDFDNDGLLDLYTANYGLWPEGASPAPRERNFNGGPNRLYHHRVEQNSHRFSEVGRSRGVNEPGWTHCVGAWDVDRDGWMDLYALNDFGPSYVFRNVQGRVFQDWTEQLDLAATFNAMNFMLVDVDHSGHLGIYVTQIMRRPRKPGDELGPLVTNRLFTRRDDGTYEDVHSERIEAADLGWAWYAGAFDYENDGDLDLLVLNGTEDIVPGSELSVSDKHADGRMLVVRHAQQKNVFFCAEDGYFYDASATCPLAYAGNSRGAAIFDLEGDGDLDIAVNDYEAPARIFENVQSSENHWLRLQLEGTLSNRSAIGARVEVRFADQSRFDQVVSGSGFLSQSPQTLHFGLGKATRADRVLITWPSGRVQELLNLAANQVHQIREPRE